MSVTDLQYLNCLIVPVYNHGKKVNPRNGERIRLHAPPQLRFASTPLVSLRKTAWRYALLEWEWFMSGSNNVRDLDERVRHWWDKWQDATNGCVKYNYGVQLRDQTAVAINPATGVPCVEGFDQIEAFIDGIKTHPHSSRHVITTWNTHEMYAKDCPITNCHGTGIQAFVCDGILDLFMYQRSCDLICGVPHNWIQYWSFLLWLAHRTGNKPGEFIWQGGDVHLYAGHLDMARRMGEAYKESGSGITTPQLVYTPTSEEYRAADFSLSGDYRPLITDAVEMYV